MSVTAHNFVATTAVALLLAVSWVSSANAEAALEPEPAATDVRPGPAGVDDVVPPSARDVLGRALDNRYSLDARASIEITIVGRSGTRDVRRAELASKHIDGQLFSIGRFTYPEELRDMAMLRMGRKDATDDYFAYLPDFRKVRRLPESPKSDMFLGSDANFEDVEERKLDDYAVEFSRSEQLEGEQVYVVSARPEYDSGYERVDYLIAGTDYAILEQRFYKRGAVEADKVLSAPRAHTEQIGGYSVPMRIQLNDHSGGTRTELVVKKIEVDPELSDRLFTTRALSQERKLPELD